MSAPQPTQRRGAAYLWSIGAALLVLGARLAEVHAHASDTPFNDQWQIEANDILLRWFDGTLRPWHFFAPHFEHLPVWTRLGVWLQVALTGRWDPLVQMTANAVAHATFAGLVVHASIAALPRLAAVLLTTLVVALGAFPHAWENIVWGFQSQFPLALLTLVIHVHGSFHSPPGSPRWWLAQAAGVAGLFTLGSMAIAPLAVVLVQLWVEPRRARAVVAPGIVAGLGLLLAGFLRLTAHADIVAHSTTSPLSFTHAVADMLGWPTAIGGGAVLLYLPLLLLGLQLRGRSGSDAIDRTVLALGVWSAAQALALAYARGADYGGYVSRYGDLLAVGVIANGAALARMLPALLRPWPLALIAALAWLAAVGVSLHTLSTTAHTHYFHERSAQWAAVRRGAVQSYLQNGDSAILATKEARALVFGAPERVARALDHPRLRAALPHSLASANAPDAIGQAVRMIQSHWRWVVGTGMIGLVAGLALVRGIPSPAPLALRSDRFQIAALGLLALTAGVGLMRWPRPLLFDAARRWEALIAPPGAVRDLHYDFVGPAELPKHRIWGAALLWPPEYRNWFSGTRPDLSMPTATILSPPFRLSAPWLVIPIAGFPVSPGNTLRLEIASDGGPDAAIEIAYTEANPASREVVFWQIDVSRFQEREARIRMIDTRGETEDWVAAGPPILTHDAALAARHQREHRFERFAALHQTLGWSALALGGSAVLAAIAAARRQRAA